MEKYRKLTTVLIVVLALLLSASLPMLLQARPADASTVIGYQSVTMLDGTTAYTTTTYSSAYLVGGFGEVVLQIHDDVSGTNTITVTPQFSTEGVACSSVTDWVDASTSLAYADAASNSATITVSTLNTNTLTTTVASLSGGTTLTYGSVDIYTTITGDDAAMLSVDTAGRCMRVKLTTATTFTPTVYAWMVNRNE